MDKVCHFDDLTGEWIFRCIVLMPWAAAVVSFVVVIVKWIT